MTTGEVIALIKAFGGGGGGSSGGGVLVVHDVEGTLDKTWKEIHDALLSGGAVIAYSDKEASVITGAGYAALTSGPYIVETCVETYKTPEADGYPVMQEG